MECTFEQFIEEVRKVLRETDQLSKDLEELLRSYGGIQKLKIAFKDSSDGGRKNALELKVVCEEIVNSTYIATKIKAVFLSFTIEKAEPHRVNIPERLRPKAEEIEKYSARIKSELHKADTLLQKIERKVGWNKEGTKQTPLSGPFSAKQCCIWCKLIFELCDSSKDKMR